MLSSAIQTIPACSVEALREQAFVASHPPALAACCLNGSHTCLGNNCALQACGRPNLAILLMKAFEAHLSSLFVKLYCTRVQLSCFSCAQGLAALHVNPILADSTTGLATSATAFAAIEVRCLPASA